MEPLHPRAALRDAGQALGAFSPGSRPLGRSRKVLDHGSARDRQDRLTNRLRCSACRLRHGLGSAPSGPPASPGSGDRLGLQPVIDDLVRLQRSLGLGLGDGLDLGQGPRFQYASLRLQAGSQGLGFGEDGLRRLLGLLGLVLLGRGRRWGAGLLARAHERLNFVAERTRPDGRIRRLAPLWAALVLDGERLDDTLHDGCINSPVNWARFELMQVPCAPHYYIAPEAVQFILNFQTKDVT